MSPHSCDPAFADILSKMRARMRDEEPVPIDDAKSRRALIARRFSNIIPPVYEVDNVNVTKHILRLPDGHDMPIYRFQPQGCSNSHSPTAGVLYLHGGGMTMGSALDSKTLLEWYASAAEAQIFSVEYRLAPENPYPTPAEDCYQGLKWLYSEAGTFNLDRARIAVMGESAGGGLAAGVCLHARDRAELSPRLAKQILIQPMLDDRTTHPVTVHADFSTWTHDNNLAGWTAFLGSRVGTDNVSCYAAPARATDLRNLPSTYLDVGQLDIFREEASHFASRLRAAGVQVEFHLYPGVPHGFHHFADAEIVYQARNNHLQALCQI